MRNRTEADQRDRLTERQCREEALAVVMALTGASLGWLALVYLRRRE